VAVKIKLKRMGKIRAPYYRIIVADARTKRDGRAIEEIGKYHPKVDPSLIEVDSERAQYWLSVGAQPTDPVRKILEVTGDWQKFKGLPGAEGTLRTAAPRPDRREAFAAAVAETVKDLKVKGGDAKTGGAKAGDGKAAEAKADKGRSRKPAGSADKPAAGKAAGGKAAKDDAAKDSAAAKDDAAAKVSGAKSGVAKSAAAKDGAAKDSAAKDGAAKDGAAKDSASDEGAAAESEPAAAAASAVEQDGEA
jgi:small subunit ribosomal protein S16